MEQILYLVNSWYVPYADELILGFLVCTLLLMIAALFAVRRCRRQIRELTEKTKEMTKLALSQSSMNTQREKNRIQKDTEENINGKTVLSPQNEEIFGSVIQEIFP
ncbi:MAG: hypothetical protein LUE14_08755 [Clostridiales bacterium]|nr:hypothetical protein [Clostridiales bacterium]MCD8110173.1 hypothetical protein [Clostridiales bacterium]